MAYLLDLVGFPPKNFHFELVNDLHLFLYVVND